MAEHAPAGSHSGDMDAHRSTYENFIKGSIALSLVCFFILVALVSFRFAHTWSVFVGAVGLLTGIVAVAVEARTGGRWLVSLAILVVFGLITAVNVS